ncbi:hypothetical protein D9758_017621 [Tetrapyrgos nigripes]|uniref:Uncharacterized protein n=1 Tax=Tetrapyrgos nigripes TaxID=182062 RepID=A0A8H5BXQ1_9AGAR|nr:hypothetical protein D9758_017621 [Tetrapyrgos nigripes]
MQIVSKFTTYFNHSNYGSYHLRQELKKESNQRGIESYGATRFSTFADHNSSIIRCFSAIQRCYTSGVLKFDTKATKELENYIKPGPMSLQFLGKLYQIDALLKPIAWGLKTLEGQHVTCSDVFFVFVGISIGFNDVFTKARSDNPDLYAHRSETFAVYNRRFRIFMNDCTPGMFLLAYLLDPIYYSDSPLRLALPPREHFSKKTASKLVIELMGNAIDLFRHEQLREGSGSADDAVEFAKQLTAYMYREAPFNRSASDDHSHRLGWWEAVEKDSNAHLLAKIGRKLFSVLPSEMPDERSASKMTAFSTSKRNRLSATNIIETVQLQNYWRYGFKKEVYSDHHAHLTLPKGTPSASSGPIEYPAPTLEDLLNPIPENPGAINEDILFDPADLYGVNELVEESDDDDDDLEFTPQVIRTSNLERLDIEDYVDLSSPLVRARYTDPGQPKPQVEKG